MAYNNILLPVDGSKDSISACEVVTKIAGAEDRRYNLVHCVETIPNIIGGENRDELIKKSEAESKIVFQPYIDILKAAGCKYETHITYGSFGREIVEICDELKCDAIVMGTRGMSNFKSILVGSVSNDVLEHAKVPVMLIKSK